MRVVGGSDIRQGVDLRLTSVAAESHPITFKFDFKNAVCVVQCEHVLSMYKVLGSMPNTRRKEKMCRAGQRKHA